MYIVEGGQLQTFLYFGSCIIHTTYSRLHRL